MNFERMKNLEPELRRLELSARVAGSNGATWLATLHAIHEALSKAVGRGGMVEALQTPQAYETARAAIFASWSKGSKTEVQTEMQTEMFDCSEVYQ